jgi:hypothetical protein
MGNNNLISELSDLSNSSKQRTARFVYFVLVILLYIYIMVRLKAYFTFSILKRFCFITYLNFYINFAYYFYALLLQTSLRNNLLNLNLLRGVFKFCYSCSFTVAVLYWSALAINPNLTPKKERGLPFDLEFFIHGGVFLLNLWNMC